MTLSLLVFIFVVTIIGSANGVRSDDTTTKNHRKFCIVGGGPAGVQTAYFFKRFGISRNEYVVFERASEPGNFFTVYPRQRNLISINKVYTGTNDTEFNLRHDWNSLLNHEKFDNVADPFKYYPSVTDDEDEEKREQNNKNSLKDPLLFSEISKEYYPKADTIPEYLRQFTERYKLNIQYNTDVASIKRHKTTKLFYLELLEQKKKKNQVSDENHQSEAETSTTTFTCRVVIMASGKSVERSFKLKEGTKLLTPYSKAPTDPAAYANEEILILGAGNAAFELAKALESHTALVHVASRNPIQLAHQTHYVGDVRAVNLGFLDRYQLKSMDVLMTLTSNDIRDGRLYKEKETGRICLRTSSKGEEEIARREMNKVGKTEEELQMMSENGDDDDQDDVDTNKPKMTPEERAQLKVEYEASMELFPSRRCYHRVIACLGFRFNNTVFVNTNKKQIKRIKEKEQESSLEQVSPMTDASDSFIEIASNFESVNTPDLYVAGALAHYRDFKRSAGGFIHGFRYTARTLVGLLREKYYSSSSSTSSSLASSENDNNDLFDHQYPFIKFTTKEQVLKRFMWRLKNVSSLYQMQGQLADAVLIVRKGNNHNQQEFHYYQDLPIDMLKSKTPELVSIKAFQRATIKNSGGGSPVVVLRFLTLSLEFGKDFQGVGVLHHQAQKETFKRRAEKMLWDHASPTADPDFRLHQDRFFGMEQPLRKSEKITAQDLMEREQPMMNLKNPYERNPSANRQSDQNQKQHMPASPHKTTLLNPLQEPPSMVPGNNGRPPKLNRFLFLHPVAREWNRIGKVEEDQDQRQNVDTGEQKIKSVKHQLVREVRLHEDVLNDFTGKHYHETPLKNFLDKALDG